MSSRSKLKLSLFAATALFLFDPDLLPALHQGSTLRAQDITQLNANSLNMADLLGEKAVPGQKVEGVNAAFALPGQSSAAVSAPLAQPITPVAPGQNPFLRPQQPAAPAAAAAAPAAPVPVALAPAPVATAAPQPDAAATGSINPFETKPATEANAAPAVDVTALRYYVSTRDLKRVGAEMRRLQNLYPDWQPPRDLFTQGPAVDEQPFWDIYATGNYALVRAEIAKAQSVNPNWEPSEDLMTKLKLGETRKLIDSAYQQGRWNDVISTAKAMPQIMVCGEMQVQWSVAEAFAKTENMADAFDVYHYILSNCDDPALRLATVQKAALLMPQAGTTSLLALGRTLADGSNEFEDIGYDGLRRQIGAFIENGDFTKTPDADEIARFVNFIERKSSAADANLIGWYFYAQKEWENAGAWFLQASKYKRDPKSIEGLILSLRQMEKDEDALKLARRYAKTAPEVGRQYIEIVAGALTEKGSKLELAKEDDAMFEELVTDQKSALGAQALGWKYLAANDKATARTWFDESVSWEPTEGGVVGLAVLAARAKNYRSLSALKAEYGDDYASLDAFKIYKQGSKRRAPTQARRVEVEAKTKSKPKTLLDYLRASDS